MEGVGLSCEGEKSDVEGENSDAEGEDQGAEWEWRRESRFRHSCLREKLT